jgi:ATP-dependent RNA helicase RhlE
VADSFGAYGRHTKLRHATVYGGVSQVPQVRKLRAGIDVLIATPGRLLDLIGQGHVDLGHVEILIFDEADQMLDMGFINDLRRIESHVPKKRQTLMFSATMPAEIRKLAEEWLTNPASVQTARLSAPAEKITHAVYFVEQRLKVRLLERFLENAPGERTLVFSRTKHGADKIVKHLLNGNIRAAAIHGNKSQSARQRALEQFKSTSPPVLIATDIAARGLDIRGVEHVINYDLPQTPEVYVHRIGRTGRAGASGRAVSFCASDEIGQLRDIERLTRCTLDIAVDHPDLASEVAPAATPPKGKSGRGGGGGGGASRRPSPRPVGKRPRRAKPASGERTRSQSGEASKGESGKPAGAKRRNRRHQRAL